ncbi:MAG TPA: GNAT family N-acetyltransferase [Ilumatobacteraceae bacterium]|nr:GNAT family N-acetyltransferase [Ilumatobacteraceae bacterium]
MRNYWLALDGSGQTHPVPLTFRTAVESDWPAICRTDGRAFGVSYSDDDIARSRTIHDLGRFQLAIDGKQIVAIVGAYTLRVTVPGGGQLPMGGLTWVSTATTHRRQGLLSRLMERYFADVDRRGEPVAMLAASEGGIYERFGFGICTQVRSTSIDRRFVQLREEFRPRRGAVRFVEGDEALQHMIAIWPRYCRLRAAEVDRSEAWHRHLMQLRAESMGGYGPAFYLAHRDGYAAYRIEPQWNEGRPAHNLRIAELIAATPDAHAALWHTLLGIDLVGPILSRQSPIDDPLPFLLTDQRAFQTTGLSDGNWANVRDIGACLAARTYSTNDGFVVDVDGSRWAIDGGPDGATCKRARTRPHLTMDHPSIGALLFGGVRPSMLAAGRRLQARDAAVLRRADAFFVTAPAPHCQTMY